MGHPAEGREREGVMSKRGHYKKVERELYAQWLALPRRDRKADGKELPSEVDFASHYKIDRSTLFRWKQDPKFRAKVHEYRMALMGDSTSDVAANLIDQASSSDNPAWAKLYMEFVNEYRPSQEIVHVDGAGSNSAVLDSPEFIEFFAEQLSDHPILAEYAIDAEKLSYAMKELVLRQSEEQEDIE